MIKTANHYLRDLLGWHKEYHSELILDKYDTEIDFPSEERIKLFNYPTKYMIDVFNDEMEDGTFCAMNINDSRVQNILNKYNKRYSAKSFKSDLYKYDVSNLTSIISEKVKREIILVARYKGIEYVPPELRFILVCELRAECNDDSFNLRQQELEYVIGIENINDYFNHEIISLNDIKRKAIVNILIGVMSDGYLYRPYKEAINIETCINMYTAGFISDEQLEIYSKLNVGIIETSLKVVVNTIIQLTSDIVVPKFHDKNLSILYRIIKLFQIEGKSTSALRTALYRPIIRIDGFTTPVVELLKNKGIFCEIYRLYSRLLYALEQIGQDEELAYLSEALNVHDNYVKLDGGESVYRETERNKLDIKSNIALLRKAMHELSLVDGSTESKDIFNQVYLYEIIQIAKYSNSVKFPIVKNGVLEFLKPQDIAELINHVDDTLELTTDIREEDIRAVIRAYFYKI